MAINIDPKDVARKITTKTKAIITVHVYGHPAELDPIVSIAQKNNLSLVEDCAISLPTYPFFAHVPRTQQRRT